MALQELAVAMRERRDELGIKQDDVGNLAQSGISRPTWSKLENGHDGNYLNSTFTAIDRVLKWPRGHAARLYRNGADAIAAPVTTSPMQDAIDAQGRALASLFETLAAEGQRVDHDFALLRRELQDFAARLEALERSRRR